MGLLSANAEYRPERAIDEGGLSWAIDEKKQLQERDNVFKEAQQ